MPPSQHALLSPSAAHRWLACPPSARLHAKLQERFGDGGSSYAREGTLTHAVAELKLRKSVGEFNDFRYKTLLEALGEIPAEMDSYTDNYVDEVMARYWRGRPLRYTDDLC